MKRFNCRLCLSSLLKRNNRFLKGSALGFGCGGFSQSENNHKMAESVNYLMTVETVLGCAVKVTDGFKIEMG